MPVVHPEGNKPLEWADIQGVHLSATGEDSDPRES